MRHLRSCGRRLVGPPFCVVFAVLSFAAGGRFARGQGWFPQACTVQADLLSVDLLDADTGWIVGSGGTILRTTNGGADWTPQASHTGYALRGVSFLNASFGLAVGDGGTILRTADGGASWQVIRTDWMDVLRAVHLLDAARAWAVGTNAIFQPFTARTTDGGLNWTFGSFYIQNNEGGLTDVWFTDEWNGFASAYLWDGRGAICRTANGGASWTTVTVVGFALYGIHFPSASVGVAVGSDGNVLRSTDAGATWSFQWIGQGCDLYATAFVNETRGWVVGESGWIARTTDGGAHWVPQGSGSSAMLSGIDCAGPLVATAVGEGRTILRTATGGDDPASVRVADAGAQSVLTVVPNPFVRAASLRLVGDGVRLGPSDPVEVMVSDASGRLVRRLAVFSRSALAGDPIWTWDGLDDCGSPVPAGSYFAFPRGKPRCAVRVVRAVSGG